MDDYYHMSIESEIFEDLTHLYKEDKEIVKRYVRLVKKLDAVLVNFEFCQRSSFIFEGKRYSVDDVVILMFEFYMLSKSMKSVPTQYVEVFLGVYADKLKDLARDGKLNHLL
ncbi:MAG: hypothetical protein KJ556_02565 [Gammaproteobacteria bacterium]|nr:hypothetical protein [Gammaproteobacteria bacterium]MBU2056650.1 hypothetical protein [Gammaproteobacteria bacterium]MBU2173987.1 hypothetical protein [Gammaproteobacteria bacterium]MBU2247293.1 hypothetical protein [Gammaproteobacteria bacterium]MBU2343945.1 hypothetical protein [Gammaproteobacteria bacterium]